MQNVAGRVEQLMRQLAEERAARLKAEQRLAGTKSAILKLQALILEQRAELAKIRTASLDPLNGSDVVALGHEAIPTALPIAPPVIARASARRGS